MRAGARVSALKGGRIVYLGAISGPTGNWVSGIRLTSLVVLSGLFVATQQQVAFAQAGSTGGVIGKQDKSVSGGEGVAEPRAPAKSRSKATGPLDSASDKSSSTKRCANLEGVWNSAAPSSVSENIRQTACNFSASLTTALFNHVVNGKYMGSSNWSVAITRTNKITGCTTVMRGRMNLVSETEFQTVMTGADGRCDLPVDFAETRKWTR